MALSLRIKSSHEAIGSNAIAVANIIYIFGSQYENFVFTFDVLQYKWRHYECVLDESVKKVPKYWMIFELVAFEPNIYLLGGLEKETLSANFFKFDTRAHVLATPSTNGSAPCARIEHAMLIDGEIIYVYGGEDYIIPRELHDLYCLNVRTLSWRKLPTFGEAPAFRSEFDAAIICGEKFFVWNTASDYTMLHACCLRSRTWARLEVLGDVPPYRMSSTFANYRNNLFMFGGYNFREMKQYTDFWKLDIQVMTWSKFVIKEISPQRARSLLCATNSNLFLVSFEYHQMRTVVDAVYFIPTLHTLCMRTIKQHNISTASLPQRIARVIDNSDIDVEETVAFNECHSTS